MFFWTRHIIQHHKDDNTVVWYLGDGKWGEKKDVKKVKTEEMVSVLHSLKNDKVTVIGYFYPQWVPKWLQKLLSLI